MKPWVETVRLGQPPRAIVCAGSWSREDFAQREGRVRENAAFDRGRQEGEKALSEQLVRQRSELLELQQGVLRSLTEAVPRLVRETEKVLVELALESAIKLVAGLPVSVEMVEAAVQEATAQVADNTDYTVLMNADDLALLQRAGSDLLKDHGDSGHIRFSASSEVTRGGCIVLTRFGAIDSQRETKIAILREALHA